MAAGAPAFVRAPVSPVTALEIEFTNVHIARIPLKHGRPRRIVCRSNAQGDDNPDDTFGRLRRWLGIDPPPSQYNGSGAGINPGQSVMDIEDFFANQSSSSSPVVGENGTPRRKGNQSSGAPIMPFNFGVSTVTGGTGAEIGTGSVSMPASPLGDWSAGLDEDWDEWSGTPAVADLDDTDEVAELREQVLERRKARRGRRRVVRDEYLRPIVDATGIYNRLAIGEKEAEERVFVEAITNQYESREALRYAAVLIGVPLMIGFAVSHVIAKPLWRYAEQLDPNAFALSDEQKVAGAHAMHREEVRLRLEVSIGQAPPLTDDAMLEHLREEASHFASDMKQYNKQALLNVVSDSASATALFLLLLRDNSQRVILFRTIGRVFAGLSDTAKAFLIILVTDTLLGYHSEEGWTAGLKLLSHHYGWHSPKEGLQLFVATVPVLLDSLFKYWIFVGLNRIDPAAAVTLRQMDRH